MAFWYKANLSIEDIRPLGEGTISEHIGIEWLEVGENFLKARMPVDHRTQQPYGLLHGGASVVLAETLGSVASTMLVDTSSCYCVGIEINANHVRSAKEGYVTGITTPEHIGSTTHVWDIRIYNEAEKLVCISRLTVAILNRKIL